MIIWKEITSINQILFYICFHAQLWFFKVSVSFSLLILSCRKQGDGDTQPLLQEQQQQQQIVPLQDSYMQSRAEALQNVESTIHELGSIFNQLATLVSQQGEVAIRFV